MSKIRAFTMGRYQPYGHHHHAANDWMARQIDADVLDIFIDDTHAKRLPKSPFKGEELIPAVRRAYEEEYETDYEVNVFSRDALSPVLHAKVVRRLWKGYLFLTREELHAEIMGKAIPIFRWRGYDVKYWPRDNMPFEGSEYSINESSTDIRQNILEGGEEWKNTVSKPVENMIDENYDEIVSVLKSESEYTGSKYKDAIASNGMHWNGIVRIHDIVF